MKFYIRIIFLSVFSIITIINFDNKITALDIEYIIGGHSAMSGQFTYHVSILGQLNYTHAKILLCGGCIIADNLVLSAAQCFIDSNRELRPLRFSIHAGTIYLNDTEAVQIDIEFIFIPDYDVLVKTNDIALARLQQNFDFANNPNLTKVEVPFAGQTFVDDVGVVTGNGYTVVLTKYIDELEQRRRYDGRISSILKYALVRIVNDSQCLASYIVDVNWQMCGVMMSERPFDKWGICTRDTGSPLVIDMTVVGIVSRNTPECDDTIHGCIYTKVSAFMYFIENVMEGNSLPATFVYSNPTHTMEEL